MRHPPQLQACGLHVTAPPTSRCAQLLTRTPEAPLQSTHRQRENSVWHARGGGGGWEVGRLGGWEVGRLGGQQALAAWPEAAPCERRTTCGHPVSAAASLHPPLPVTFNDTFPTWNRWQTRRGWRGAHVRAEEGARPEVAGSYQGPVEGMRLRRCWVQPRHVL